MPKNADLTDIDQFDSFLIQSSLMGIDDVPNYKPLPGGVSSDIWHVELPERQLCIKRAQVKLKVKEDWLKTDNMIVPECAPRVLAHGPDQGMFVMLFIPLETSKPWKEELQTGSTEPACASTVWDTLAAIHAANINMPELAQRFTTDKIFQTIRLNPYLELTANQHPDLMPVHVVVDIENRPARLLPRLFLARIDGKLPVVYITRDVDKDKVRQAARVMLKKPVEKLTSAAHRWADGIGAVL